MELYSSLLMSSKRYATGLKRYTARDLREAPGRITNSMSKSCAMLAKMESAFSKRSKVR